MPHLEVGEGVDFLRNFIQAVKLQHEKAACTATSIVCMLRQDDDDHDKLFSKS
jgi:hypothetical protein